MISIIYVLIYLPGRYVLDLRRVIVHAHAIYTLRAAPPSADGTSKHCYYISSECIETSTLH